MATPKETIRILCGSMTPTTLAAIIADLDANDQTADDDQRVANSIRAYAVRQLICLVGERDAERMVARS
jgi:hypothetical protein